jgi:outer membrane protein OmpA-like peptidoglycan-associated protein
LKNFKSVLLTGHADERGTDELNMDLSRDRLDTVAHFLKEGGFNGNLELVPKGKREPFTGVDRSQYGKEELFQLDRRVELVITH